jgi:hypothetical protein
MNKQAPASTWHAVAGGPITDQVLEWPPDVFALTNVVLGRSGAFRFALAPVSEGSPGRHPDWTGRVPRFAYEFNDDNAPQLFSPPGALPAFATHCSEYQCLFGLPNAPYPGSSTPTSTASMRTASANFAASGDPSSAALPWPSFDDGEQMMSLVPPQPQADREFASRHHCVFWSAGADREDH